MSRLLVLTTRELAVATASPAPPVDSSTAHTQATSRSCWTARTESSRPCPVLNALPLPLRRQLDSLRTPLVVALPAGTTTRPIGDRRQRLLELLRQAIGYEITFGDEGTTK